MALGFTRNFFTKQKLNLSNKVDGKDGIVLYFNPLSLRRFLRIVFCLNAEA